MFKRIIWMGTGMAVGAGGAFWAKHKVEATIEQYLPDQVVARVGTSTRDLGRTVRAAAAEGREAMRATEAELRARVDARTFVGLIAPEPAAAPARPATSRSTSARASGASGARRTSRVPNPAAPGSSTRRRARR